VLAQLLEVERDDRLRLRAGGCLRVEHALAHGHDVGHALERGVDGTELCGGAELGDDARQVELDGGAREEADGGRGLVGRREGAVAEQLLEVDAGVDDGAEQCLFVLHLDTLNGRGRVGVEPKKRNEIRHWGMQPLLT
jgi:hypothetical protein